MLYHVPENLGMMLLMLFFGKELLSLAGKMGHLKQISSLTIVPKGIAANE